MVGGQDRAEAAGCSVVGRQGRSRGSWLVPDGVFDRRRAAGCSVVGPQGGSRGSWLLPDGAFDRRRAAGCSVVGRRCRSRGSWLLPDGALDRRRQLAARASVARSDVEQLAARCTGHGQRSWSSWLLPAGWADAAGAAGCPVKLGSSPSTLWAKQGCSSVGCSCRRQLELRRAQLRHPSDLHACLLRQPLHDG